MTRKLTIIESPLAASSNRTMDDNIMYLRDCMRDSWSRGELPFASHCWGPFFLNEHDPSQRQQGIEAGYEFWNLATIEPNCLGFSEEDFRQSVPKIVFYCDHGISTGMRAAFDRAKSLGREVEMRYIVQKPEENKA